jgi:pimeloyl-ACP methyl ester carboxylesterase
MTVPINEGVLERKGCPLHYWTAGPEGRPLVVFTHGACVDHHSFDPHIPVIAQDYRVLSWDVRGHGRSQPMGDRFNVPLAVDDLLALLDRIGYQKAVHVGHSSGTYITQELVFRYPERVQALVIADGTCITWKHSRPEMLALRFATSVMALFPFETLKKASLKNCSLKTDVQDYTYRAFSQISKHDFLDIQRGVYGCLHYEPGYHISQPLLLTHGDDDYLGDIKKIAPLWARREPNCQYVAIPNARHFAILDNPDFFNRLLLEFLSKWVSPGSDDAKSSYQTLVSC